MQTGISRWERFLLPLFCGVLLWNRASHFIKQSFCICEGSTGGPPSLISGRCTCCTHRVAGVRSVFHPWDKPHSVLACSAHMPGFCASVFFRILHLYSPEILPHRALGMLLSGLGVNGPLASGSICHASVCWRFMKNCVISSVKPLGPRLVLVDNSSVTNSVPSLVKALPRLSFFLSREFVSV